MWRIRLLRILVPLLLVPFVVLLVLELRPRRSGGRPAPVGGDSPAVVARGVEVLSLEGARKLFDLKADEYLETGQLGEQRVRGVERFTLYREDSTPLDMSADSLEIRGEAPHRIAVIQGGLEIRDREADMEVSLPVLEVVEAERQARSTGDVRFRAPGYTGTAAEVVYPLDEGPTAFRDLRIESERGDRLEARTALLFPDSDRVELTRDVSFRSGVSTLESPSMVVQREPGESWVRAVRAEGGVRGRSTPPAEPEVTFRSSRMEADWSEPSTLDRVALLGDAVIRQEARGIGASEITARRVTGSPGLWDARAEGGVVARDRIDDVEATLACTQLTARVDENGVVIEGAATGDVRFAQGDVLALSDRASLRLVGITHEITLSADGDSKARFAQADRRVAADTITVRPETRWMRAVGRAEATLLGGEDDTFSGGGMFRADEAIHFVSRTLESGRGGDSIRFEGDVRGWQGERNLSADVVRIDRATGSLEATQSVSTRLPLRESSALSEGDYVQVSADSLTYVEADSMAEYVGNVRVRQDLGWLECDRLEIVLSEEGDAVERLLGHGDVEFQYFTRDDEGMPYPVDGRGDRIEFLPAEQYVRLFGDREPAEVRTSGPRGGTTRGRVVRYGLADGSVEVEGGVSIRTGDGG